MLQHRHRQESSRMFWATIQILCRPASSYNSDISFFVTDIQGRSQNLGHFLPRLGAQIGGLRVFPVVNITVVCQVRMSPASTAVGA